MAEGRIDWAGVAFLAVGAHDASLFKAPGLYGFARREWNGERTLLYIGQAEVIAVDAAAGGLVWSQALGLGMNELHVCLCAGERIDRLQLQGRIVRRVEPILNLLGRDAPPLTLRQARA